MRRTPALVALLVLALFALDAGASEPIRPRAIRDRIEREAAPPATRTSGRARTRRAGM